MKRMIFIVIAALTFCLPVCAQKSESNCPQISLELPNVFLVSDEPVILSAKVDKIAKEYNLRYEWIFSGGKILDGQGTPIIKFITNKQDQFANIKVSLKVIGLPEKCGSVFSNIIEIAQPLPEDPYDQFGKLKLNDLKARLDNFMILVSSNPEYTGLLEIVFDKKDSQTYKTSRLKDIVQFFEFKKFNLNRISLAISEGSYEENITCWLIPPNAKLPKSIDSSYILIKGKNLKLEINNLFLKK